MNIQMNRDWVTTLVVSLPEYADELGKNIQSAMTGEVLDEIDAHACALAAALADRNGELAFEISMSSVLFGNDIRTEVARAVVDIIADNPSTIDNPTLYKLVIAIVMNQNVLASLIVDKLDQAGVESNKIEAAQYIARLIPAISRCLI